MKFLIIDHYDSFTHTIAHYFEQLNAKTMILQADDPKLLNIDQLDVQGLIFSPGPGHPNEQLSTLKLIQTYQYDYPMLGICLGMQCMAVAFGGRVVSAHQIYHGQSSRIEHRHQKLFTNIPNPIHVVRYHSLMVEQETLPHLFEIDAWTIESPPTLMAISHQTLPIFGVQYHPEAILSEHGFTLFSHFIDYTRTYLTFI